MYVSADWLQMLRSFTELQHTDQQGTVYCILTASAIKNICLQSSRLYAVCSSNEQ
jgi:hypothetical protein